MALTAVERFAVRAADEAMAIARAGGPRQRVIARFEQTMRRYSDVGQIADFSLGPYRRRLHPTQREEFYRLVENFAGRLFATYVAEFAGSRLEIIETRAHGPGDFVVRSRIQFDSGRPTSEIDWRILRTRGGYRVFDMKVRGIWLMLEMRSHFISILRQNNGSIDALLTYLRG